MDRLRVVSWNIAGARTINSLEQHDYSPENIDYFAAKLKKTAPDVVCLQETHTNDTASNGHALAERLGMPFVLNTPNSPSHIDPEYQLSNTIVSRHPFTATEVVYYPNPSFPLYWEDLTLAPDHPKGLQLVDIEGTTIGNTQLLPIDIWHYDYEKFEGAAFALEVEDVLLQHVDDSTILCGDFNYDDTRSLFNRLYATWNMTDALPATEETRPTKREAIKTPDHIIYSPKRFDLLHSEVRKTRADHHICIADFAKK